MLLMTNPITGLEASDAYNVRGKAVVISGGATGIGRATAALLAEHGARVLIFGRHESEVNEALESFRASDDLKVDGIVADQSRVEEVQRVFHTADERMGGCDILINNAAVAAIPLERIELDDVPYVIASNLLGYITCARGRRKNEAAQSRRAYCEHRIDERRFARSWRRGLRRHQSSSSSVQSFAS